MDENLIHVGDCLDAMRRMDTGTVQTCVTSPPYFRLRDYEEDGQLGQEATPAEFVQRLVEVFREVRRVLRDDGTLWLNLGDTYASKANGPVGAGGHTSEVPHVSRRTAHARRSSGVPEGFKHKQLIGIPWRVALALQDDGWFLRQDIIWAKPNPMPESVKDRCAKSHEYIFLLSKSSQYYFDHVAIQEPAAASSVARWSQNVEQQAGSDRVPGKTNGTMKAVGGRRKRDTFARSGAVSGLVLPGQSTAQHRSDREDDYDLNARNKRSVWTVATVPSKEKHFAMFPERLIEPCILAGSPAGGIVLDPFMGAGTTGVVAQRLGRRWIGCELNRGYAKRATARIRAAQPGLSLGNAE